MADRRVAAVTVALLGMVSLGTAASTARASPPPYTVAATQACILALPDALAGLPPATWHIPPFLFVYRSASDRLVPPVRGQLDVYVRGSNGRYEGIVLSFFASARAARAESGGTLVRNVVLSPEGSSVSNGGWRDAVRDCLRAGPLARGMTAPKRAKPRAGLATFVGYWGGHTRGLRITSDGRGVEYADDGCCMREYDMTFQIVSVGGSLTRATAIYRVTSYRRHDAQLPRVQAGRVGKLQLKDGIVTNSLTQDYFCSDTAWGATGACGA
jgi:hypothetical protein